jgi:guanylate kinase
MSQGTADSAVHCVVSGPSGSGRTTLCRGVSGAEGCQHAISAATRAPRPGEVDGRDYHFPSDDEFRRRSNRCGRMADILDARPPGFEIGDPGA